MSSGSKKESELVKWISRVTSGLVIALTMWFITSSDSPLKKNPENEYFNSRWANHWAQVEEHLSSTQRSTGFPSRDREHFIVTLKSLELWKYQDLQLLRDSLIEMAKTAPAPLDSNYNVLYVPEIRSAFNELRNGVRNLAVYYGVSVVLPPASTVDVSQPHVTIDLLRENRMKIATPIAVVSIASILVAFSLRVLFRILSPKQISGYRYCGGGWWEAKLNRCREGLLMLPQQPVNTYTNLAYLAGGLFLAFYLVTPASFILALISIYLCIGSALYHATSTWWAGAIHIGGIYAIFTALTVHSASVHVKVGDNLLAFLVLILAVLNGYFSRYKFRGSIPLKIFKFLILIYAFSVWGVVKDESRIALEPLIISSGFFLLGYLCYLMDIMQIFPFKRWGHGLWHIFTAGGIFTIFYANYLM